jgi:hypothetical protein
MNSGGASFPRAAASNAWKWTDMVGYLLLFPSLPAVRNTITCNNRKRTTQSILFFCFLFCRSASLVRFFSAAQCFLFVSPSSLFSGGGLCDQGAVGGSASVASGRRRWRRMRWSDRRLQLSLLLSPAAAGAAAEMGEDVFGHPGKKGYCWVCQVKFGRMVVEREGNQESQRKGAALAGSDELLFFYAGREGKEMAFGRGNVGMVCG